MSFLYIPITNVFVLVKITHITLKKRTTIGLFHRQIDNGTISFEIWKILHLNAKNSLKDYLKYAQIYA